MENNENVENELIDYLIKNKKFDKIEISIKLINTLDNDKNITNTGQVTINQLNDIKKNINIYGLSFLFQELIKNSFLSVDELEYFKIYQPSHYAWLHNPENPNNIIKK
jgi:hypothetical protein